MGLPFWRVGSLCISDSVARVGGVWQRLARGHLAPGGAGSGILFWGRALSGIFGHFRADAPHSCPLPRPIGSAREGAVLAALGEGVGGLRAWCLYP
jgi:hypothetical protein